jgi:peptidoglycan/xylan/chitin deacetylase (PgdA/CDA1 family)/negative regulator of sigma E activity
MAPRRLSYEGTKAITVWGAQVQASEVRVYHAAPDETRLEYLAAGAQPKRIVVIKGRMMRQYDAARNVIVERPAPAAGEERLLREVVPRILSNYTIAFDGADMVAGRPTRVVVVRSKFAARPSVRIWIDSERRLILRFERYTADGRLQESAAFLNITYDPPLSPDLFTVPAPPGAQVQPPPPRPRPALSLEEIAQRVGFPPQVPAYLPQGFQLTRQVVRTVQGQPAAVFLYSDGLSTLTLFESRGPKGALPRGRPVRVGGADGQMAFRGVARVLHWNAGGISYTLVGDLPPDELLRVGASVPQGSSRRPLRGERAAALFPGAGPASAEAAEPARPLPLSPYMTNDTHPTASAFSSSDEWRVWRALRAAHLTPVVVKLVVAGDHVPAVSIPGGGRLAWVRFIYGMDWTGGAAAAVREVQETARALAAAAFGADPRIAEVVLTGQYHDRGAFDVRRTDVTFTADLHRDVFLAAPADLDAGAALAQAGDAWYSPDLRAGDLVVHRPRPHEARGSGGRAVILPGDRSAERGVHFRGTLAERAVEVKHRLDGLLFGFVSGGRLWRGDPRRRALALTFDDGPDPVATPLLLDTLRRFGVRATFFVIGERAVPYPFLIKAMAADGHEVEDHTFHHPDLTTVDPQVAVEEVRAGARAVEPAAPRPHWLRPPGGDYDPAVLAAVREEGMGLAMWSGNSGDWTAPPPAQLVQRVTALAEPGAVILLHNGTLETVRALPAIITALQARGYELVTLADLAHGADGRP